MNAKLLLTLLLQVVAISAYHFVLYPVNIDEAIEESSLRPKRSFDRIENSDFGLSVFKRSIPLKRAFDRLDFTDFSRRKRAFDRLDFTDFSMRRKRSFDRIENSDFGLFKRSVAPMPLTAGVENVQDLDDQSRAALVQQLADSIRTLRRVREAEQTAATEEEKKQ
ncbi:nlp-8 [Pristionchus pacificus]|uniref:Nlp-8 n=1 Tax=Pristionchus pacificus TaxID=54126 RepID=A0A2A6BKZ1_PRIPA|nr:nlp-8 [Pristionchus pacificus]|eukprot:PDM66483.1 nlp-8 [Pristionchus pacificus]